ncbi:N-acetylmuramic acid 6-phosphate (MurNAc-6-P) etherase [Curtobacterium pusillum]|uniref:N-acetylmuramic acid 6-phosphate (MurNAc-6-P) etherase n=1 Tax=Curtobacterium pusillum TaxID=69373 RepID=A0AAW3T572_9MICO|nr:N-acetylmuramic acid 6-phosphate (MurNAc-6-P) etherase [Curtobacterium pusillum]
MTAETAQKLVLDKLITLAMVRSNKTYSNRILESGGC